MIRLPVAAASLGGTRALIAAIGENTFYERKREPTPG
jgi:hypothetical protein